MKDRYFIVFFSSNENTVGFIDIYTDGCYVNISKAIKHIEKLDYVFGQVILTNIIELSKKDYKDAFRKDKK